MVKQTVMTSVYGVTYIGARDQIKRRLKERCAIEDDVELFAASCYAAKVRKFDSIELYVNISKSILLFSLLLLISHYFIDHSHRFRRDV